MLAYKLVVKNKSLNVSDKYSLSYKVGKVTEAIPGTLGIFCYTSFRSAKLAFSVTFPFKGLKIIEVEGIGGLNRVEKISNYMDEQSIDNFYDSHMEPEHRGLYARIEPDVVCFNSVRVIREVYERKIRRFRMKYYFVVVFIGFSADEELFVVRGTGDKKFFQEQLKIPPTQEELKFADFQDEEDENMLEDYNPDIEIVCGEDISYICPEGVDYIIEINHEKGKYYQYLSDGILLEERDI